ncbi:MAG: helix-turn-helix domain-containing protein, partial [Desulfococcus multivorans]|nr:helix-turn-helix domain-containing protein [Desulfococcus multivorans]
RFSQALYHRINVFNIELAPLRERKEDIPLLVEHFRRKLSVATPPCQVSKKAMQCLMVYDWPGNIRELQNVIERGIILAEEGWITERGLPRELVEAIRDTPSKDTPFFSLADMEKNHIQRVMRFVGGNRAKASEILGIGRKTLYRKLKSYETENENAPSFN